LFGFTWEGKAKIGGKLQNYLTRWIRKPLKKGSCEGALNNGKWNKYPTKR
jgi:hypothetical protein